jgi:hypothetical protein
VPIPSTSPESGWWRETPASPARRSDAPSARASRAWWRPSQLGRSTHTLTAILRVNATSLPSCYAKYSLRPAPRLHCCTKADFRMSGPAPHGMGTVSLVTPSSHVFRRLNQQSRVIARCALPSCSGTSGNAYFDCLCLIDMLSWLRVFRHGDALCVGHDGRPTPQTTAMQSEKCGGRCASA